MYIAFKDISLPELITTIKNVNIFWLLVLILITLISHILRAWRWQILLNFLKEKISIKNLFGSVMIGYLLNLGVPRFGEIARPYILSKRENINWSAAFGTIITERLLDFVFFLLFIFGAVIIYPNNFTFILPAIESNKIIVYILAILVFTKLFLILFYPKLVKKIANTILKIFPKNISKIGENLTDGILSIHKLPNLKDKFSVIVLTIAIIFCYTISFEVAFKTFVALKMEFLKFDAAILIMVASGIAFALPAPSGFGTYHAFVTFVLTTSFLIPKEVAINYSIATHELNIILIALVGCYYFVKFNLSLKQIKVDETASN